MVWRAWWPEHEAAGGSVPEVRGGGGEMNVLVPSLLSPFILSGVPSLRVVPSQSGFLQKLGVMPRCPG